MSEKKAPNKTGAGLQEPYTLSQLERDLSEDFLIDETLFPVQEVSSLIKQLNVTEKITALLTRQFLCEVRIAAKNEQLKHYGDVIKRVEDYIRRNLSKKLTGASGLLLLEALVYGLDQPLSENVLRKWEKRCAEQSRCPELPIKDSRGRRAKSSDYENFDKRDREQRDFIRRLNNAIEKSRKPIPTMKEIASQLGLGISERRDDILRRKMRDCGVKTRWNNYVKKIKADNK